MATYRFYGFVEQVAKRLDQGRLEYGNKSFGRDPSELLDEIQQELLDVCGWAFVLWCRLEAARAAWDALQLPGEPTE